MNNRFKLLGIAPYEAMKNTMIRLAHTRADIALDVQVADLANSADIVENLTEKQYDAIISRGGTAQFISQIIHLPVIDISLSVYDILRAIKLAENYQKKFAIVGFPNITESAHLLCDLLQYNINIITINNEEEVVEALTNLKKENCYMVVCDMVSHNTAKKLDMNSILITSGPESIHAAFNQAVKICKDYCAIREENDFLRSILKSNTSSSVVIAEDGTIFLSTLPEENEIEITEILINEVKRILTTGDTKFVRSNKKTLYSIAARTDFYDNKKVVIFHLTTSTIPISTDKYGIRFSNKDSIEESYYNSFYSIAGSMGTQKELIEKAVESSQPIMILAEDGIESEQIAGFIYVKSSLQSNPFIFIDCGLLDDRAWQYLLNDYNSPFSDNNNTIYFHDSDQLSETRCKKLLTTILDTNLRKRNRLIFSCKKRANNNESPYIINCISKLSCITVGLLPLRDRKQEIPLLAKVYLPRLNIELGKQLVGFEPHAMELLENYSWPQNYLQFSRLLSEAAALTTTSYICAHTIASLLDSEQALTIYNMVFDSSDNNPVPKLTLDEITQSIVEKVLSDNNGNHSVTARQLGISRTTLWRYNKRRDD